MLLPNYWWIQWRWFTRCWTPIILLSQASTSARHRIFVKERSRWMDFTGLGTTLSTTGRCLTLIIIYHLIVCSINTSADFVTTGTSASSLMVTSLCWPPPRTRWLLSLTCALRTSGTPLTLLHVFCRLLSVQQFLLKSSLDGIFLWLLSFTLFYTSIDGWLLIISGWILFQLGTNGGGTARLKTMLA